jgi:glycosyltransferase involved in cell wall biosynthesis
MISVIICSVDEARFAAVSQQYVRALGSAAYEIIRISDARSLCEGYNRGVSHAKGDILIFSHDDIEFLDDSLAERLPAHLRRFDLIGVAGSTRALSASWFAAGPPYIFGQVATPSVAPPGVAVFFYGANDRIVTGAQIMDGLFLTCRRKVAAAIGWDDQTFDGFHGYDADFTYRAHLAGFKLAVVNDIYISHASSGDYGESYELYAQRFRDKHQATLPRAHIPTIEFAYSVVPDKESALAIMGGAIDPIAEVS